MTPLQITEASLVLFWAGYIGLNVWLLRTAAHEDAAAGEHTPMLQPRTTVNRHGEDYA